MHNRGEAVPRGQARSDGAPQPALDPLLAHFSAMGMAQVLFPAGQHQQAAPGRPSPQCHGYFCHGYCCKYVDAVCGITEWLCIQIQNAASQEDMLLQNARQNAPLPQQQQHHLGQGLGSFGGAGANANQQNTLASLLAGAYSQSPGEAPPSQEPQGI